MNGADIVTVHFFGKFYISLLVKTGRDSVTVDNHPFVGIRRPCRKGDVGFTRPIMLEEHVVEPS